MTPRIIVVGGGISGLAAAHRLAELTAENHLGLEIALLEAGERLGGCIMTERVGDFLAEAGPDSFISEKPWALDLCERIGLGPRLTSTNAARQSVSVVHTGRLEPLPEGFLLMAPTRIRPFITTRLFSWRGKLRMASELFRPRGAAHEDESLAAFVRRRFGREALERVVQPLIGGIYAADPEKLSLAATMPRFLEMERACRSVTWAMWREQRRRTLTRQPESGARWSLFLSLLGGMRELVDTLAGRLPDRSVQLGAHVIGLTWSSAKKNWVAATNRGQLEADGVILATPAYAAAAMLSSVAPELSQELREIPYGSTATVNLAYRENEIPPALGFGLIAPAVESRKILACTFSSVKYPGRAPDGFVLLRAFVGGALQPFLFEQDDAAMEAGVRQELAELLGITAEPLFRRIHRHPRSMPQYPVGHLARVERIEEQVKKLPGLALAGNAYRGVGIADCVHSGERAAENLLRAIEEEVAT
ncbi:MAG TPA: protoporphyrinogen oxidase [Candidatus Binatia bacterium]|jgi:oxygen-dependent protoporphyrinogen oxidase